MRSSPASRGPRELVRGVGCGRGERRASWRGPGEGVPALPALLATALLLTACNPAPAAQPTPTATPFPLPDRPVASIVSSSWSDEASRDNSGETEAVLEILKIAPGQTIADIGAGSGYYTARLSPIIGPTGKIYAQDIIPDYLTRLKARIAREKLSNVTAILGAPDNPNLPPNSIDTALMVHMYHEIEQPYALLWNLHPSLKPTGQLAIIDANRETQNHGTPPALLKCEVEQTGYTQVARHPLPSGDYMAIFKPTDRPDPETIKPCPAP